MLSHTLCVPFIRFQRAALDQRRLSRVFPLKQRYKIFIDAGVIDAGQHLDLFLFLRATRQIYRADPCDVEPARVCEAR